MIPEYLLHYIWANRIYSHLTIDGKEVEVRDTGHLNSYDGPDFSEAKVYIDGIVWIGAIEIHRKASEWRDHQHNKDPRYCSVILHVVLEDNCNIYDSESRKVPTAVMSVSPKMMEYLDKLEHKNKSLRCMPELLQLGNEAILDKLLELLPIRLEEKLQKLRQRSETNDLNTLLYQTLVRYVGAKQNNDVLECVAQHLPYTYLKKHATDLTALEAMLIGQAGLIKNEPRDDYEAQLLSEYLFYQNKFGLTPIAPMSFSHLRLRPSSFPTRMLAIVASIINNEEELLASLTALDKPCLIKCLSTSPSDYWQTHFDFGRILPHRLGGLGKHSIHSLIINALVPTAYLYATTKGDKYLAQRAIDWLYTLPPENNQYIKLFTQNNILPKHAAHTQALLQLYHNYCEPYHCLKCPLAIDLFSYYHSEANS